MEDTLFFLSKSIFTTPFHFIFIFKLSHKDSVVKKLCILIILFTRDLFRIRKVAFIYSTIASQPETQKLQENIFLMFKRLNFRIVLFLVLFSHGVLCASDGGMGQLNMTQIYWRLVKTCELKKQRMN